MTDIPNYYGDWRDERIEQRRQELIIAYKAYKSYNEKVKDKTYVAFSPLEELFYDL